MELLRRSVLKRAFECMPPDLKNRVRLNFALERAFWREAWHGGFW